MDRKHEILARCFGYSSFREGQETLIDALLTGRDALGIMPTGGGKSICYQVPALLFTGITVVISPLISLMQDQVMALKAAGISAAYVNSTLTPQQLRKVYDLIREGRYKIVYAAPERILTEGFLTAVRGVTVSMVSVDEAHCISEWGQDFRPSYLKIPDFLRSLPSRPVLSAFTATATERVRRDIVSALEMRDPYVKITGFDRPNLRYEVLRPQNKEKELLALLQEREGKSGIVYCSTRKKVDALCVSLASAGIAVTGYHAGLTEEERARNQEAFLYDRARVMVATNAFGMGIDKSNVSFVIHYNMPKSIEEYYQEAGRAGRDGAEADCLLLFSQGDIVTAKYLIETSSENDELTAEERETHIRQELSRLDSMIAYCKTTKCLRGTILSYFGQPSPTACGHCGNCEAEVKERDITTEAKMILSCISRIHTLLGYHVGAALVISVLRAGKGKRIRTLALDTLSTYGLMRERSEDDVRAIMDALEEQGFVQVTPPYRTLTLTEKSGQVLFGGLRVTMAVLDRTEHEKKREKKKTPGSRRTADPDSLYEHLRAVRAEVARAENVPAYVVFSNATLQDMAKKCPRTEAEFRTVSGVGAVKAAKYASLFLSALCEAEGER